MTGHAKYAVEFEVPKCAYAWPVESNIAKGKITAIDTKAAQSAPGVLTVLTHQNAPQTERSRGRRSQGFPSEERTPLADDEIHYAGQYVALVVAQTIEQARHAASFVRVSYAPEEPLLTMEAAEHKAKKPKENNDEHVQLKKGDVEAGAGQSNISSGCTRPTSRRRKRTTRSRCRARSRPGKATTS